ncbi:MAG: ComEC/Rec2 family competence protein [Muribaculaceae bacterium]|nr:ComEC/Rec2 family competence protein [Muribaculaceae bacterium]
MKPPFSYVPLMPVFIALASGILFSLLPGGIYIGIVLWVLLLALLLLKKPVYSALTVGVALGWSTMFVARPPDISAFSTASHDHRLRLIAIVNDITETPSGRRLDITVDKMGVDSVTKPGNVRHFDITLYLGSLFPAISPGDIISCSPFFFERNRSVDLPDTGNMFQSIEKPAAFADEGEVTVIGRSHSLLFILLGVRDWLVDRLYTGTLSPSTANLLAAVLLGDSTMIDSTRRASFSASGLAHLLALSGAHVAVIIMILSVVIMPLQLARRESAGYVVLVVMLWIYVLMTGFSVSVVRAVIMATFVAGAYIFNRRRSSMNSLFAAAILILVFNPTALFEVSFQLSFLAAASILLLMSGFMSFTGRNRVVITVVKLIALPVAAMAGTWALSVYYFGIFPLLFLLSSIPASLIMTLMLAIGAVYLAFAVIGIDVGFIAWILNALDRLLSWIIEMTTSVPWGIVDNIYLPPLAVILFTLVPVALAAWFWRRRVVWAIATVCLIASGIAVTRLSLIPVGDELYITTEKNHTNVVTRRDHEMRLYTTARQSQLPSIIELCETRYKRYMSRRECDTITGFTIESYPAVLYWNGHTIAVIADNDYIRDDDSRSKSPDYILVCRGFRGDILTLVSELSPRATVILSNDLNRRRHDRYLSELTAASIPVYSVRRDGCFRL